MPLHIYVLTYLVGLGSLAVCGVLLTLLVLPFVTLRHPRWGKALLFFLFACASGMVIWVGDPNLLYTLPFFAAAFFLATAGDRVGRLAVCMIFFCLTMSVSALADTYLSSRMHDWLYADLITRAVRPLVFGLIYLFARRRLPKEPLHLSRALWTLVALLAAMPLCALCAVVLLTMTRVESPVATQMAFSIGLAVLPMVLLSSLALLAAAAALAKQEALERANHLATLRELYYESLRQQDQSLRQLRHDLRNHLTVLSGLLELGKSDAAGAYLAQLVATDGLKKPRRYCEHDMANIVLANKAQAIEASGMTADFDVALPEALTISDVDLCALLGNALDNAREGAAGCSDAVIHCRLRLEKNLLMLTVDNPILETRDAKLATTKADKTAHGFGLPGMRDIARRCHGSLDTRQENGRFTLTVCLSNA